MFREMCKSKIHLATVTETNLFYAGSITIDFALMKEADIYPGEKVQIANINNGSRMETYVIQGEECSGKIELNGAAARLAEIGDTVLIISYALMADDKAKVHSPKVVHVNSKNRISKVEISLPDTLKVQ